LNQNQLFFIALLPPLEVQDYASQVQQVFAERYHSRAALRSPPHVTLQPPFQWQWSAVEQLTRSLHQFASQQCPVPMRLSGFRAFAPRVIYIHVERTSELLALHQAIQGHLEETWDIVDPVGKTRPFAPHLTVGFRDLTKPNFKAAWAEFQNQEVEFTVLISQITLLLHNGQRWEIFQEFPLGATLGATDDGSESMHDCEG
jgi:2'-5' RNA ligase